MISRRKFADGSGEADAPDSRRGAGEYEGLAPLHPQKLRFRDVEARVRGIDHHIWQYPAVPSERYVPAEFADFGGLNFREALSRQNRTIYEVRDDTIYLHVVADTRRDLRTLLQKRQLRSRWEIQLIDRCLDAAMSDQSPDGGTHVLPKRLTTTENGISNTQLTVCADCLHAKTQNRLQHVSRLKNDGNVRRRRLSMTEILGEAGPFRHWRLR